VKSWKRRFFTLDKHCTLRYFDNDPQVTASYKLKGSLHITNYSQNVNSSKIPRLYDSQFAFSVTTTDPKKAMMIMVADSLEEKMKWLEDFSKCLRREAALDMSNIMDTMIVNGKQDCLENLLRTAGRIDTSPNERSLPANCCILIACYIGDVSSVARLSGVNSRWHSVLSYRTNELLRQWLVRYGTVSIACRWKFWCYTLAVDRFVEPDTFSGLISQASDFNKFEIDKDVNRAYGTSVSKRMTDRRSLLPSEILSAVDDSPTPRKYMNTIHEGSDDGNIDKDDDDDDDDDDALDSRGRPWGRNRGTMRWPDTPQDKSKGVERERASNRRTRKREHRSEGSPSPPVTPPRSNSGSLSPPRTPPALTEADILRKKESLTSILRAFSTRFESVGYCQGLDRIVVHLMRAARCAVSTHSFPDSERHRRREIDEQRERECFTVLEALFESMNLSDVYSRNSVFGLRLRIWQLAKLFEIYCPDLHRYLEKEGLSLEIFSIGWIQTLFLYAEAMPANTIDRIWDVFIVESSWTIIFQVAIAIMRMASEKVIGKEIDEVIDYFNTFPDEHILDAEILLPEACNINVTEGKLSLLEEQYKILNA